MPEVNSLLRNTELEKLRSLIDKAPLHELASEIGAYYKQLRKEGFNKEQAYEMTFLMHALMCKSIFEK